MSETNQEIESDEGESLNAWVSDTPPLEPLEATVIPLKPVTPVVVETETTVGLESELAKIDAPDWAGSESHHAITDLIDRNFQSRLAAYDGDPASIREDLSFGGSPGIQEIEMSPIDQQYWLHKSHAEVAENLIKQVQKDQGMSRDIAMEAREINPAFDGGLPVGYYTVQPSATRYAVAQESLIQTLKEQIQKLIKTISEYLRKTLNWIMGGSFTEGKKTGKEADREINDQAKDAATRMDDAAKRLDGVARFAKKLDDAIRAKGMPIERGDGYIETYYDLESLAAAVTPDTKMTSLYFDYMNTRSEYYHDVLTGGPFMQNLGFLIRNSKRLSDHLALRTSLLERTINEQLAGHIQSPEEVEQRLKALIDPQVNFGGRKMSLKEIVDQLVSEEIVLREKSVAKTYSIVNYVDVLTSMINDRMVQDAIEARKSIALSLNYLNESTERVSNALDAHLDHQFSEVGMITRRHLSELRERADVLRQYGRLVRNYLDMVSDTVQFSSAILSRVLTQINKAVEVHTTYARAEFNGLVQELLKAQKMNGNLTAALEVPEHLLRRDV